MNEPFTLLPELQNAYNFKHFDTFGPLCKVEYSLQETTWNCGSGGRYCGNCGNTVCRSRFLANRVPHDAVQRRLTGVRIGMGTVTEDAIEFRTSAVQLSVVTEDPGPKFGRSGFRTGLPVG